MELQRQGKRPKVYAKQKGFKNFFSAFTKCFNLTQCISKDFFKITYLSIMSDKPVMMVHIYDIKLVSNINKMFIKMG